MSETWLVAHDFSPCSDAAALEAARLLEPMHGTLRLLHVHAPIAVRPEQAWGEATFALHEDLKKQLGTLATSLRAHHPGIRVDVDVIAGDAVSGILAEAKRQSVGHIVVGTHGRSGVAHLVLGSVAERVVRQAEVPVLVVKSAGAAVSVGDPASTHEPAAPPHGNSDPFG